MLTFSSQSACEASENLTGFYFSLFLPAQQRTQFPHHDSSGRGIVPPMPRPCSTPSSSHPCPALPGPQLPSQIPNSLSNPGRPRSQSPAHQGPPLTSHAHKRSSSFQPSPGPHPGAATARITARLQPPVGASSSPAPAFLPCSQCWPCAIPEKAPPIPEKAPPILEKTPPIPEKAPPLLKKALPRPREGPAPAPSRLRG